MMGLFAFGSFKLRASCQDGELEADHLILYVFRFIQPQFPPHNKKSVLDILISSAPTADLLYRKSCYYI